MQATEPERVKELEAAISLRRKEIEDLEKQKALFQSEALGSDSKLQHDPLLSSFPVIENYVECSKRSIQDIPVEQVVHVLSQLTIADRAIIKQNNNDAAELKGLQREIEKQQNKHNLLSSKLRELSDSIGLSRLSASQQQQCANIPPLKELKARKKLVQREIQAGNVVREKKGNTITKLSAMVEARRSLIDEIDQLYNQLRVVDCDTTIEMEKIERLNAEVEDADLYLERKRQELDSVSFLLVRQDAMELKTEKNEVVNSQRIPQERVVKAQDYRLAQLEKRLKAVEKILHNNYLKRDVDKILINKWSSNTIDVSKDPKDLYDIEQIIPAQEKIHPGVYNLFLSEKEKVSHTVSLLNIGTKEKEEVIASLVCKLEALCCEFNMIIEELDELTIKATHIEEAERKRALAFIQEQRSYIYTLTHEKKKYSGSSMRQ
ncbi:unnamed protein product [Phytomonas sp. EM1]|nr:unnamed protein product [Phytomonas sp. EM1]|eukprot:CCW61488.1 unnamed protein product [Phytomonas sp. isolate EM1]